MLCVLNRTITLLSFNFIISYIKTLKLYKQIIDQQFISFSSSEMSWYDCLKLGQSSEQQDNYVMAKYWMETALEKLNSSVGVSAAKGTLEMSQFEIYEAMLNLEFHSGKYGSIGRKHK